MQRIIQYYLDEWRTQPNRKPLILRGARQVGKTYAVRQLAKKFDNYLEINFEAQPEVKDFFEKNLQIDRIVKDLSLFTNSPIIPGKTLLFFDEIQEAPKALLALRYFYEVMPELHVIAAGSLLDFAIDEIGVPVGRVSFLYMYPMSFLEFLKAKEQVSLCREILKHPVKLALSTPIHNKLLDFLGEYMAVGGMPEAVQCWKDTQDIHACSEIHHSLISAYQQDFQKYSTKNQIKYVELLFQYIPAQLGKPFKYSAIHGDYRKRELVPCVELLTKAIVAHRVTYSAGHGIPLGAEANSEKFKLIFLDIALCQAILGLTRNNWLLNPQEEFINKGGIAEAMVGQELLCYRSPHHQNQLYYWHREVRSSNAEIDYLINVAQEVVPVEVKSGHGSSLKSMRIFLESHPDSTYGMRFSTHNYSIVDAIHSYPLYAIAGATAENKQELLDWLDK